MSATGTRGFRDRGGFAVFSGGSLGEAHVLAHRLLDEQRYEEGHRRLGAWLEGRSGSGSEWTHVQWHMAVFELSTGRVSDAAERFEREILPSIEARDAATDGPSLLWRLELAGHSPGPSWDAARRVAARSLDDSASMWVQLHHVMALAGAGDLATLDRWLDAMPLEELDEQRRLLVRLAWCLRTFATRDFAVCTELLRDARAQLEALGGSSAQRELFADIERESERRARRRAA